MGTVPTRTVQFPSQAVAIDTHLIRTSYVASSTRLKRDLPNESVLFEIPILAR